VENSTVVTLRVQATTPQAEDVVAVTLADPQGRLRDWTPGSHNPEQGQRLRAEPSLARVAFDEAVRWESPVQTFFRTATTTVRVGEHVVIGQHVARLEAEALLTALVPGVERLELAGPTRRHHNNTLRAWESIPVRVDLP
jgi:cytochrome P450